jgi:hypothetical protein
MSKSTPRSARRQSRKPSLENARSISSWRQILLLIAAVTLVGVIVTLKLKVSADTSTPVSVSAFEVRSHRTSTRWSNRARALWQPIRRRAGDSPNLAPTRIQPTQAELVQVTRATLTVSGRPQFPAIARWGNCAAALSFQSSADISEQYWRTITRSQFRMSARSGVSVLPTQRLPREWTFNTAPTRPV